MEQNLELIQLFKSGDHKTFEQIYSDTKKLVYNIVYKMTLDVEESNDIMHDVYVKVYENRTKYKPMVAIKYWICKIAVNHTKNILKQKSRHKKNIAAVGFFYHKQIVSEEKDFSDGIVLPILSKMNEKYKLPIILKDIEELSYIEIAEVLNIKIGTVRSRLNRGRKILLELYKKKEASNG